MSGPHHRKERNLNFASLNPGGWGEIKSKREPGNLEFDRAGSSLVCSGLICIFTVKHRAMGGL